MYLISFFLGCSFVLLVSSTSDADKYLSPEDRCIAEIRKVMPEKKLSRTLGGIVGIGWDALENKPTRPVFAQKYEKCQTLPDVDFLIPDGVDVLPIRETNFQKSSETFESFSEYKNSVSAGMKVSAGGGIPGIGSASGSLSVETKVGKEHMEKHKQTGFRSSIEYHAFELVGTEKAGFDEVFARRLEEIAKAIKDDDLLLAQYEAESVIADYGTHVTNKATAGAKVTMLSFAETSEIKDKRTFALKVAASFKTSVMGIADMGTEVNTNIQNQYTEGEKRTLVQSYIFAKGGPEVKRLFSDGNDKMQIDNLVGLNHEGMLLYSYIHPKIFNGKEWTEFTTFMVQDFLRNATIEYIRHNTIPGCTDSSDAKYFHRANVDNIDACGGSVANAILLMDGYYQTCEYVESYSEAHAKLRHGNHCDGYRHRNPLTKDYTCFGNRPNSLYSTFSFSFDVTNKDRVYSVKSNECNGSECSKNYTITDRIKVTTYFCDVGFGTKSMQFGGIFQNDNIFSDNKRCAQPYEEYPILHKHTICLSTVHTSSRPNDILVATALYFGGIKQCGDNSKCYWGSSRYYLGTINNCPLYYCAGIHGSNKLSYYNDTLLPYISKPPYVDRDMAYSKTRLHFQNEIDVLEAAADG